MWRETAKNLWPVDVTRRKHDPIRQLVREQKYWQVDLQIRETCMQKTDLKARRMGKLNSPDALDVIETVSKQLKCADSAP